MSDTPAATGVRPLAVVTGASTGIGFELARLLAEDGHDLIIAADTPLAEAARTLEGLGARVEAVETDLAADEGVDALHAKVAGRQVEILVANAGHGLGGAFLDQDFEEVRHLINTNVTGTLRLVHLMGRHLRAQGRGRILFTGSIAGLMPGSFQAAYNASKAFVDSFSFALRNELKESGVTVTVLMPGPTDTEFFDRAGLEDTIVGQGPKMDAAKVAKIGYRALLRGDGDVVAGLGNKLQAAAAAVTPQSTLAEMHRKQAEPGSGES